MTPGLDSILALLITIAALFTPDRVLDNLFSHLPKWLR